MGKKKGNLVVKINCPILSQGNALLQVSRYLIAFLSPNHLNFFHTSTQSLFQRDECDSHVLPYAISFSEKQSWRKLRPRKEKWFIQTIFWTRALEPVSSFSFLLLSYYFRPSPLPQTLLFPFYQNLSSDLSNLSWKFISFKESELSALHLVLITHLLEDLSLLGMELLTYSHRNFWLRGSSQFSLKKTPTHWITSLRSLG